MKQLADLVVKPSLKEMSFKDEATGEDVAFYMIYPLPLTKFFEITKAQQAGMDMVDFLSLLIPLVLDKDGKQILSDDAVPSNMSFIVNAATEIANNLGK